MGNEKVLNLPLSGAEIKDVLVERYRRRLDTDCYLHDAATYNGFSLDMNCTMKFVDMNMGKSTLIWDKHQTDGFGVNLPEGAVVTAVEVAEKYESGDSPNKVRLEHDLEIPVQVQEGRNTVIRKRKFPKGDAV